MLDAILSLKTAEELTEKRPASQSSSTTLQDEVSIRSAQVTDEMEAIFITSLYSSLGASLEGDSRLVFDDFVKKLSGFVKVDDTPAKRATLSKFKTFFFFAEKLLFFKERVDKIKSIPIHVEIVLFSDYNLYI